ncbi:hypothetical protein B0H66DRAFT_551399 [Apodospora peruviana]|uniref:Mg2+ transporter protein, CorA-like/Zinc transport protein ZntB n=1 Tax=Apodospora peruviana TaxID=516989 RepID=A0AAE0MC04_9PEZI|nr:hypothetical protein B0H66DRAFT_551399 [Apodospora peruviana]
MENDGAVDFEWLADLSKWQCFTTCELSHPAKSLDFGSEGFTASLTDWHELLQLTRPDATCGLVFLRGPFPDNPGSILSRAQRRDDSGSKGTFGTRLLPPEPGFPDVELGERKAQGWVNFRWPYTQHELVRKDPRTGDILGTGSCDSISFVSRGTVFQVNRLKWGHGSSLSEYDLGPAAAAYHHANNAATARFRVGGRVRFGCPCSNNNGPIVEDAFTVTPGPGAGVCCTSKKYQTRLEIGLTENGVPRRLAPRETTSDGSTKQQWIDLSCEDRIEIPVGDATYLVSSYALRNDAEEGDEADLSTSLPADLEDYLGVSRESLHMTDRLWTAMCAANYEAVEAVEFCIVGRCVEQILGVTSIPVRQPPGGPLSPERALIGNIMTSQYVDVQSAFFQIRLLVKIHNFIKTRKLERDFMQQHRDKQYRALGEIRDDYLARIRDVIRSSLAWLFATDLKQSRLLLAVHSTPVSVDSQGEPVNPANAKRLESCMLKREELKWDTSYNRGCYATMAAWYILKMCPAAITSRFVYEVMLPKLPVAYQLGMERASRDKQPTAKGNVLQWLHFSCILLLYEELGWEENNLPEGVARDDLNLREAQETQERFEKYVSRLKTTKADGWSMEHEELDRVLLLAEELGLDHLSSLKKSHSLAVSRARQTRRRIRDRRRTTKFNAGPKQWMTARSLSNGPWELLCTNHESYLRVADEPNVIPARDRLFEFLLSDYSFMASWDRADANMVGRWWDIQPVTMICATLLDLKLEGKLQAARGIEPSPAESDAAAQAGDEMSQSIPNVRADTVNFDAALDTLNAQAAAARNEAPQAVLIAALVQQLRHSMEEISRTQVQEMHQLLGSVSGFAGGDGVMGGLGGGSEKALDWVTQKPSPTYYPGWWVQSLDDTPDIFRNTQSRDVDLRAALKQYLGKQDASHIITRDQGYTVSNVSDRIREDDLRLLDVFDVFQDGDFTFYTRRRRCKQPPHTPASSRPPSSTVARRSSPLPTPTPTPGHEIPGPPMEGEEPDDAASSTYDGVLKTLNDSLVDVGAKHRILFAQKLSPELVGGFIYMWHPDALDTIDDHFGTTSRFTESRETSMWTTSITISHWTIRTVEEHRGDRFRERHRQNGDFPPENIASLGGPGSSPEPGGQTLHVVEEQSSSLVFTGDSAGYLWICSALSSATNSESISPVINNVLPKILEKFIHQQASGRCLAFLLLLGHLCEKLAAEYGNLLARLDDIMEIGDRTLLEGLEDWWGTTEAINKLKKMLWGWEALRVFNDKLSSSLSQIQRAQEAMEHTIKQDAMQQHVDLIQEYNSIVEEFKKRYGMLVDVHDKTQLKIKQVTGLRDGISTITNVVDTQTALADNKTTIQQGNNIRTLTYITIFFLPLGFVTALYSIQHGDFMDGATDEQFVILIIVFSVTTYLLAFSLDRALVRFEDKKIWLPAALKNLRLRKRRPEDRIKAGGASAFRSERSIVVKPPSVLEEGIPLEEAHQNGGWLGHR